MPKVPTPGSSPQGPQVPLGQVLDILHRWRRHDGSIGEGAWGEIAALNPSARAKEAFDARCAVSEMTRAAYQDVCDEIIRLAQNARDFPCSGMAAGCIDNIVAYARKAHVISDHRMGIGCTFMEMPEANIFRFREAMQLEFHDTHVAPVRGRGSPFMPPVQP